MTISICYTNCHITCSKFPPLADTHACSQLRLPFTALSMAFSVKADQISESASVNLETVLALVAACNKTPAFPQAWQFSGLRSDELGTTHYWR